MNDYTSESQPRTDSSKAKWTWKDYRNAFRKGMRVVDAGLHLWMAAKNKNLVTMGTALTSVYEAVETLLETKSEVKIEKEMSDHLRDMGVKAHFWNMRRFIYSALISCDISYERFFPEGMEKPKTDDLKKENSSIERAYKFDVGSGIYVTLRGDNQVPNGVYYKGTESELATALSKAFSGLGSLLALRLCREWGVSFASVEPIEIDTGNYAGALVAESFCDVIKRFREGGHNRSSLFVGPPGVGKTTFAAKIAEILGGRLFAIEALALRDAINDGYDMSTLFKILKPQVVLLDDLDRISSLEYMLGEMSRYRQANPESVIIGAVNDLTVVPLALRRPGRFDEIIEFTLPNREVRLDLIRLYGETLGTRLLNGYTEQIADLTDNMSHADIKEVMLQSTILSFDELKKQVGHMKKMMGIPDNSNREKISITSNIVEPVEECPN